MVNLQWRLGALVVAGFVIAGCAAPVQTTAPVAAPTAVAAPPPPPRDWPVDPYGVPYARDGSNQPLNTVFYFDFDQSIVARTDSATLSEHAAFLRTHSGSSVGLAGHCDARGTREYNLALGERRADAVRDYLVSQGVSRTQIMTQSFGEERPAVQASGPGDEAAFARNRRVRMTYTNARR